ncbi:MAG: hypothetical protein GWN89_11695, partial [Thermoplasmata archaeon]|nr:hypothetical protein [Thermoplasmata archaeon]NIT77947.1 hypothetical protein [Thermoplasmata archaeon]NIY04317.1 hypothetical protein [Thermoplasmata archaeon]
ERWAPLSEGGYSIAAVLVALVLLSVGILALANAGTQTVMLQTNMATRTNALEVARTYMEEVRSRNPIDITSEDPVQVDEEGQADASGVFTRELIVEDAGENMKKVSVEVAGPNIGQPIQLTTLV